MLVDPFADFLKDDDVVRVLPRIAIVARSFSVLLFVLDMNSENNFGKRYSELRNKCLPGVWHASLPKLGCTNVRGESRYNAEVVLVMANHLRSQASENLQPALEKYCHRLGEVLGVTVTVTGNLGAP